MSSFQQEVVVSLAKVTEVWPVLRPQSRKVAALSLERSREKLQHLLFGVKA